MSGAPSYIRKKLNTVGETQNVDVRVGSNAGNICISLWNTVSDRLSVSIRSPSGELVGRVPAKAGHKHRGKACS